eukprot:CAMPEP_0179091272 /NCGR_PEP_ID=MMETSP0796-20121207/41686_1 /TAXON_ID=73915 /ORGANISM="Pyrodinium bahamense, Strain pbaha01" /LENGTH=1023 /DNA_ID=CAMNT_0020788861 /DNA_START=75 /DNA_END=3142 /DNA_ORIENTATION=+
MVTTTSIDNLFRQKNLHEIHDVLKQTRMQVESKKRELRELVGDHYRSVLESSDHIRAMSECAAKVSAGADRIECLIASMRELAANPPVVASAGSRMFSTPAKPAEDHEFRAGVHVMALLEIPETVRAHLGQHEFARAARAALVDAEVLQEEVSGLLSAGEPGAPGGFDLAALVGQQRAVLRGLPRQIAASCLDAFGAVGLECGSAAESFAVHLLLNPSAQPLPLLRLFLERRTEVLRSVLDGGNSGVLEEGMNCGARLAAAALAFEGTIFLASGLCTSGDPSSQSELIQEVLAAAVAGGPECTAAEERAAIEGRAPGAEGISALRRRAEVLSGLLRNDGAERAAMAAELARLGRQFAHEWVPENDNSGSPISGSGTARSLSARFSRLVATAPGGQLRTCEALGGVLKLCTDKVLNYRSTLTRGSRDDWQSHWRRACKQFCPGRVAFDDALTVVTTTIEAACAEVVRERIADLQLELVSAAEGGLDEAVESSSTPDTGAGEAQSREDILEMQRQSRLRVACFDEQLGEVISDLGRIRQSRGTPPAITAALLDSLRENLGQACDKVRLPPVTPLWPLHSEAREGKGQSDDKPRPLWSLQRSAARASMAFDALLLAAAEERPANDAMQPHLRGLLRSAVSSGDPGLASQASAIEESLRQCSTAAYCAWARLAVAPEDGGATLEAFWRLADDEVPPVCGWGSAKFPQKPPGAGGASVLGADGQGEAARAVPVPVQASPFVAERLALGARRALEVSGGVAAMPPSLVLALKVALAEAFAAAYEVEQVNLEKLKKSGMHHLLQWLFDLNFLRITLSAGPAVGAATAASPAASRPLPAGGAAYTALLGVLDRAESAALSDPVDRLLYQEVLKASVKTHIQGVKILLAPFFLHNPLYSFLFQSQVPMDRQAVAGLSFGSAVAGATGAGGQDSDGFELQATLRPPLRPDVPRFLLLPVANALVHTSSAELDARLGLSSDSAERAAARAAAASAGGAGSGAVSSLMQQVGSGLGSLGLTKALGGTWTSSWSGG